MAIINNSSKGHNDNLERQIQELNSLLADQKEQLIESEKMGLLGQLTAGIAHEINTPLGALNSNTDLFARTIIKIKEIIFDPKTSPEIRENKQLIEFFNNIDELNQINKTACERMVQIVNSIRRYARQDDSEEPVETEVREIFESTLTLVHHEIKNRITVHRDYGETKRIKAFPNQLNQVFINLIINASQAIEESGEIFLKTYQERDYVVIEIRDTGSGMSDKVLQQIFKTGFTTKSNGMGVGLSIVKRIIQNHHGDISVKSEEGLGTTFSVRLPAAG